MIEVTLHEHLVVLKRCAAWVEVEREGASLRNDSDSRLEGRRHFSHEIRLIGMKHSL